MKTRKITIPPRPAAANDPEKRPRERRKLHVRFGAGAGDGEDDAAR